MLAHDCLLKTIAVQVAKTRSQIIEPTKIDTRVSLGLEAKFEHRVLFSLVFEKPKLPSIVANREVFLPVASQVNRKRSRFVTNVKQPDGFVFFPNRIGWRTDVFSDKQRAVAAANHQIEVAVAIQISEGGRARRMCRRMLWRLRGCLK